LLDTTKLQVQKIKLSESSSGDLEVETICKIFDKLKKFDISHCRQITGNGIRVIINQLKLLPQRVS